MLTHPTFPQVDESSTLCLPVRRSDSCHCWQIVATCALGASGEEQQQQDKKAISSNIKTPEKSCTKTGLFSAAFTKEKSLFLGKQNNRVDLLFYWVKKIEVFCRQCLCTLPPSADRHEIRASTPKSSRSNLGFVRIHGSQILPPSSVAAVLIL